MAPEAILNSMRDAEAVIEVATRAAVPSRVDPAEVYTVVVPAGAELAIPDLERYQPVPARKRGTVTHHTGPSLAAYVTAHAATGTALYADLPARKVTAVLDGHQAGDGPAGWGQHRAVLTLRHTPAWERWAARNGQIGSQASFAEHLEDGAPEIVDPPAAEMLELAQTFQANTKVAFKSATAIASGQRQLVYEETVDAKAGAKGQITIPARFTLGVAPFEGSDAYRLEARLRYRIREGTLSIGYILDRPEDIIRAAFNDVVAAIENVTLLAAYHGQPA